jgi:hypothetical protein
MLLHINEATKYSELHSLLLNRSQEGTPTGCHLPELLIHLVVLLVARAL